MQSLQRLAPRAIAIKGQGCPERDKIVLRKFGAVAKVLWPHNTAAHLAAIAGTDERTGKRWLRGEHLPPITVVLACLNEMFRSTE